MSMFTQSDLDALNAAIAQGAEEVQYRDKKVKYRSLSDMIRLREMMMRDLGLFTEGAGRVYMEPSKGLDSCSTDDFDNN